MARRQELERKVEEQILEMRRLYQNAGRRIERELTKATLTDFQRFRYQEHQKQIKSIVSALNKEATGIARRGVSAGYELGTNITATALRRQGVTVGEINLGNQIHTGAVEAIADQMTEDLVSANDSMGRTARQILRHTQQKLLEERQVNELIARGVVQGETRKQVSRRLSRKLRTQLDNGQFVSINGRNYTPEYYAQVVARTRTREASTQGNINIGQEYDVDLYQVSVHEDACPICQPIQGKVYSFSGANPDFPELTADIRPPIHPNCEHVLVPYVAAPDEDEEYDRLSEISQSENTYIHGQEDYKEVLGGRTPAIEPKIISEAAKAQKRQRKADRLKPAPSHEEEGRRIARELKGARTERKNAYDKFSEQSISVERKTTNLFIELDRARADGDTARVNALEKQLDEAWEENNNLWDDWRNKKQQIELRQSELTQDLVVRQGERGSLSFVRTGLSLDNHNDNLVGQWRQGIERMVPKRYIEDAGQFSLDLSTDDILKGRAYYQPWDQTIAMDPTGQTRSAIHEFGHHIEDNVSSVNSTFREFYNRRTRNESFERLEDLFPNYGYRANEQTKKDKFMHPYMGKEYTNGTELVSMGLEMMHIDPVEFAYADEEHFTLIYRLMRGDL